MSEWTDDEIVYVSAIEHYSYCPRQYALIHIESIFDENIFTLRGTSAHERTDIPEGHEENGVIIERAVPIWSDELGLQGKTDVVEFYPDGSTYPVEYKFGPRREKIHDDLQLCAQALCLEEMLGRPITKGAVYYHSSRKRRDVELTDALRNKTKEIITCIRQLKKTGQMPPPVNDARCPNCSLIDACIPSAITNITERSVSQLFTPIEESDKQ